MVKATAKTMAKVLKPFSKRANASDLEEQFETAGGVILFIAK
jgi:hypothetical protein